MFSILNSSSSSDLSKWLRIWNSWDAREIFAHPHYLELFAADDESCYCALLENNDQVYILFPFILRPLKKQRWSGYSNLCDLISPYGYGGPYQLSQLHSDDDLDSFWRSFIEWCDHKNVVSLFTRLALGVSSLVKMPGSIMSSSENIVCHLYPDPDLVWRNYAHKVRKNVKRAKKSSLNVEFDSSGLYLEEFLNIYLSTMDRRSAKKNYYFDRDFFLQLISSLDGNFIFAHVFLGGQIISSEIVLLSANNMYSFLGGTYSEFFDLRPNDLLKHEVVNWGILNGKKSFVLGGGYLPNDGIYNYKLGFAPNGSMPFNVNKFILNQTDYDVLTNLRKSWESLQGHDWDPDISFFPIYRA